MSHSSFNACEHVEQDRLKCCRGSLSSGKQLISKCVTMETVVKRLLFRDVAFYFQTDRIIDKIAHFFMCLLRNQNVVNLSEHFEQEYGLAPEWTRSWRRKSLHVAARFPQLSHSKGFSIVWILRWCIFRSDVDANLFSHPTWPHLGRNLRNEFKPRIIGVTNAFNSSSKFLISQIVSQIFN